MPRKLSAGPGALEGPEAQNVSILIIFVIRERTVRSMRPRRLPEGPGAFGRTSLLELGADEAPGESRGTWRL